MYKVNNMYNLILKALASQFPNYQYHYKHEPPLLWQVDSLKRQCFVLTNECILHNTKGLAKVWASRNIQPLGELAVTTELKF
jgi:hypothetical protein